MSTNEISSKEAGRSCPTCGLNFDLSTQACPQDGTLLLSAEYCHERTVRPEVKSLVGTVIADHYQLLEFIGEGGMSLVYKAEHLLLNRLVAIKLLKQPSTLTDLRLKRFIQEAKAISTLSHPNIINVLDFGLSADGTPYMVIDFIEGRSFTELIEKGRAPDVPRLIHILTQCCDALQHAHSKGVLHRDFKPSNVMLVEAKDDPDFVKILDFGIAKLLPDSDRSTQKLTRTGEVFGSPLYMSPEQCLGKELDLRSDIYGVGCVMYEALTGQPPLMGDTILDTMNMQIDDLPESFSSVCPDLHIPKALERIVLKALEKDPSLRQQSMDELKEELNDFITSPADRLSSALGYKQMSRPLRKRGTVVIGWPARILAASVLLLAIAGGTQLPALWTEFNRSPQERAWLEHMRNGKSSFESQNYADSEREFKSALALAEHFGQLDNRYSTSLKNLRDLYRRQKDYKRFAAIEKELAAVTKARLFAELKDTQSDMNKLAELNLKNLSSLPKSIDKKEEYRYEELADTFTSLANISLDEGNLERAEQMFVAAKNLDEKVFGEHSWQAALKMNDLAFFYLRQNEFQKAEPLLRKALPIMQKSLNVVALSEQRSRGNARTKNISQLERSTHFESSPSAPADELKSASPSLASRKAASDQLSAGAAPSAGSFAPTTKSEADSITQWLREYTQVLRLMEREVQANQMEKHLTRLRGSR